MVRDKLLIVDDENAEVLGQLFEGYGFNVEIATDGRLGVEVASTFRPDMVLLDLMLPVLDGFEVLDELIKRGIETRVIMFSGYLNDIDTAIRCVRSGACDFVTKLQMSPDKLSDKIKKYILVENTINLRITDNAPIIDKLIIEANNIKDRYDELHIYYNHLKSRNYRLELGSKALYTLLALLSTVTLFKIGVLEHGYELGVLFLLLFLFLLIPSERIQKISAELVKFKANVTIGNDLPSTKKSSQRGKPRG